MNREDVIRMAREAGLEFDDSCTLESTPIWYVTTDELVDIAQAAYAAGVAAEREKIAAWMIDHSYATGHGDTTEDLLKELEWQIRESEREACAQVCDGWLHADGDQCAEAIRAREEK